jgi:endonuclease/exonuclease/phosphatase family metal-dependent hydrolase
LVALSVVPALVGTPVPAAAKAPPKPGHIVSVTARPGPGVGEVSLSWRQDGTNTTGYVLETALTMFSKTNPSMARSGRRARITRIAPYRRSITLPAATVRSLGAGAASGNGLFFRFYAVNAKSSGTTTRAYPYLRTVVPRPPAPKAKGTRFRVASFNVRTARATQDSRSWLQRSPAVARQIVSRRVGIVALQELGPGRADGRTGSSAGRQRQTNSLLSALGRVGGKRYKLTRTTSYVAPGRPGSTQGARILYDSSRYRLLSRCVDTTGRRAYSASCSMMLPLMPGQREKDRVRAAVAQFQDRGTGQRFWLASVHLNASHSPNAAQEGRYNAHRKAQARAVAVRLASYNRERLPVVIAGDFNSWQNNRVGNSPHDHLVQLGYYDTSSAVKRVNFGYTTYNAFKVTVPVSSQTIGVRLDQILVKGATGSSYYENVMKVTQRLRPSDHNMILSDIVL